MCGVDVTQIDGIDETTALNLVAEVGTDLSRFPGDKHFASWLGLCPGTRISGGKVLGAKNKHNVNRAAQAFRQPDFDSNRRKCLIRIGHSFAIATTGASVGR